MVRKAKKAKKAKKPKDPKRSAASKRANLKGGAFERLIVNRYREILPSRYVRRGKQDHLADECDVVIEGVPIWSECQHANKPNGEKKLEQGERDAFLDKKRTGTNWIVGAITRQTRRTRIDVTTRIGYLLSLGRVDVVQSKEVLDTIVVVDFKRWLALVRDRFRLLEGQGE